MSNASTLHRSNQIIARNQRLLGQLVLKDFCETTSFGDLFVQLESLVQEYFHENLDSWGIGSIVGSPTLLLDLKNCDFSHTDLPAHCKFVELLPRDSLEMKRGYKTRKINEIDVFDFH